MFRTDRMHGNVITRMVRDWYLVSSMKNKIKVRDLIIIFVFRGDHLIMICTREKRSYNLLIKRMLA